MKHSPLQNLHQSLGGVFQPCGEWEVPAHYGQPDSEYRSAQQTVGLSDLSHRGKCLVTGDDRVPWLHSIISQDISTLRPGKGTVSTFMNHKGKVLAFFRVYMRQESIFLEDVGAVGEQTFQALKKFLLFGTKAKIHNAAESWGLLLLTGPKTPEVIHQSLSIDVTGVGSLQNIPFTFQGNEGFITKTQETSSVDFELFIPIEGLVPFWEHLLPLVRQEGGTPVGRQALETLRIEAGIPHLGPDINEHIVPPEANLEGVAFSLSKGCYPGQEVVARMDTYGSVKRRLVGLILEDGAERLPEPGTKIYAGSREVGWVSSSTFSPLLNRPIALGFPLRDFTQPQTCLEIEMAGTKVPARVSSLPFHQN